MDSKDIEAIREIFKSEKEGWREILKSFAAMAFGAFVVVAADIVKEQYQNSEKEAIEEIRKQRLTRMLCDPKELKAGGLWRNLKTLSIVVGLNDEQTTDLLVEIGARGGASKKNQKEGKILWGLISLQPLDRESEFWSYSSARKIRAGQRGSETFTST